MMPKFKSLEPWLSSCLLAAAMFTAFLLALPSLRNMARLDEGLAAYKAGRYEAALRKLRPLAESGATPAQTTLGHMYEFGEGVPQNAVVAYALYDLSIANGPFKPKLASSRRSELAKALTADQIEQAQSLTRQMLDPTIGLSRALEQYSAGRGTSAH